MDPRVRVVQVRVRVLHFSCAEGEARLCGPSYRHLEIIGHIDPFSTELNMSSLPCGGNPGEPRCPSIGMFGGMVPIVRGFMLGPGPGGPGPCIPAPGLSPELGPDITLGLARFIGDERVC